MPAAPEVIQTTEIRIIGYISESCEWFEKLPEVE
jgi:hypothetical protein